MHDEWAIANDLHVIADALEGGDYVSQEELLIIIRSVVVYLTEHYLAC